MSEKEFVSWTNLLGLELENCMHVKYTFYINSQDLLQKNFEIFEELKTGNHLKIK
jgi:hypothetical protein